MYSPSSCRQRRVRSDQWQSFCCTGSSTSCSHVLWHIRRIHRWVILAETRHYRITCSCKAARTWHHWLVELQAGVNVTFMSKIVERAVAKQLWRGTICYCAASLFTAVTNRQKRTLRVLCDVLSDSRWSTLFGLLDLLARSTA